MSQGHQESTISTSTRASIRISGQALLEQQAGRPGTTQVVSAFRVRRADRPVEGSAALTG